MATNTKQDNKKTEFKKRRGVFRRHRLAIALLVSLILVLGVYGYNKYLDRQNVEDMKELLASFEQLERDVEAETGEELVIEADCGSVGKFATSYSCELYLLPESGIVSSRYVEIAKVKMNGIPADRCEVLVNGRERYANALNCRKEVRGSQTERVRKLLEN